MCPPQRDKCLRHKVSRCRPPDCRAEAGNRVSIETETAVANVAMPRLA